MIDLDLQPDVGVELPGRVEADEAGEGRVVWLAPARAARELKRLVGHSVRVVFLRAKVRTLRQNRYYWGGVVTFLLDQFRERALERGEQCPFPSKEALHEAFKYRYLGVSVIEFLGERIELPPSSAKLTTAQFSAYVEQIRGWAATLGIYVASPEEWQEAA